MSHLTVVQASILGLIQGLGEFLPISSSGHLALLQYFFGIEEASVLFFSVMLHLGTLVSVFIIYWKDIVELFKELIEVFKDVFSGKGLRIGKNPTRKLGFLIITATIPTAIIGLVFQNLFSKFYGSLIAIGCGLLITSLILYIAEKMGGGKKVEKTTLFRNALFVGIMQGIAITPGISRSGSTLFAGLVSGLERKFAVKFAFLISIPSILGSVVLELPKALKAGIPSSLWAPMIVGMLISALCGIFAIKVMIKIVSDKKLSVFSVYTLVLGLTALLYGMFF